MLQHMDDRGDLNILIGDSGEMLVICSKCKKVWSGTLQLNEVNEDMEAAELNSVGGMLRSLKSLAPEADFLTDLKLPPNMPG